MPLPKSIAWLVFPTLAALAYNYEFGHLALSGALTSLGEQCNSKAPTPETDYRLSYTGTSLDAKICPVIALFSETITTDKGHKVFDYVLGTTGILVLFLFAESLRRGPGDAPSPIVWVAYPTLWLLLSQGISIGVMFPLYWLTYITFGGLDARRRSTFGSSPLNQAQAFSLLFAIILGASIPSRGLMHFKDPCVTFLWQFYPIFMSAAYSLHYLCMGKGIREKGGLGVTRVVFIGILLLSSSAHVAAVWPRIIEGDFATVRDLILPEVGVVPEGRELVDKLADFLKWDASFALLSTGIATLWFAESARQVFAFLGWYAMAVPLIGFGAAIAGVVAWVEELL